MKHFIFWLTAAVIVYMVAAVDFLVIHRNCAIILFLFILIGITYIINNFTFRDFVRISGYHKLYKLIKL